MLPTLRCLGSEEIQERDDVSRIDMGCRQILVDGLPDHRNSVFTGEPFPDFRNHPVATATYRQALTKEPFNALSHWCALSRVATPPQCGLIRVRLPSALHSQGAVWRGSAQSPVKFKIATCWASS